MTYWPSTCLGSLKPLKHVCYLNPAILPESTEPDLEFDYIDIGNVTLEHGIVGRERMQFSESPSRARKPVNEGDVIVSTVRTYLKAVARIGAEVDRWVVSTGFAVLRPYPTMESRFLYRLAQSNPFVEAVVSSSTGVSYPAINPSTLGNLLVPCPDLNIQLAIADFLDRETRRIDDLIGKKQRLLELTDEKRAALITAAVNGTGIPVLGEIQSTLQSDTDSSSVPIKRLFSVLRRLVDPDWFNGEEVYHYSLPAWHEFGTGQQESSSDIGSGKWLLDGGEILVSKLNPDKGAVIFAESHDIPTVCSLEFVALRPVHIVGRFAFYLMQSSPIRFWLQSSVESVTNSHKRARVDRFLSSRVMIPEVRTQEVIADFLDRETGRIDALKAKTLASIDRLGEYRAALITAAVTGQIDVTAAGRSGTAKRQLEAIQREELA